ncbi:hypothetical protein PanWU01x14_173380 [Parasponia andersonii]|uniref:Uncharacterized protein n=1 Tax=Parasponia andersonii TaxID=3476 RepID=A0A2P5C8P9_PARAD|nr:hypothetical protein PanWU01x14_173380 [Parasponia andersonii]
MAPGEAGWRRVTLVTVPVPLMMQTPRWRRRAKVATLSTMSQPSAISMTWVRRALALSRVMMMGGFGLFLDPAGLPLGRLDIILSWSSPEPETRSLPPEWSPPLPSSSSPPRSLFGALVRLLMLLPVCSSSELCCCCCCWNCC